MCQLCEAIRVLDGVFHDLEYHQERFERSRRDYFGIDQPILLKDILNVPENHRQGIVKCRVIYRRDIEAVEYLPWKRRTIRSLKIVRNDRIDYLYKYEDKTALEALAAQKGDCDDVLIVKNGLITDTSFSNVAFFDDKQWLTPAEPLLCGTKREKLLQEGILRKADISPGDLGQYISIRLINAMMDWEDSYEIPVEGVFEE
jgi:4-amino-4-deoxychorismate lyase